MDPLKKYPFLRSLVSPLSSRHRDTVALIIAAIAATGQAQSFAVATTLARWLRIRVDSAVNRFYRLLRNTHLDEEAFLVQWLRTLCRDPRRPLLVAVDWTEWHSELRMLVAAVVVGKRGIPLYAQAFERLVRVRSQNARENTFARMLADAVKRAELKAILLCDRGFRRVSWIALLQRLGLGFVVRLQDDVYVELPSGTKVTLRDILLVPGEVIDLGVVALRSDGKTHARVVGYWAPDRHEPWWLVTDQTGSARHILKLYDRRMTVEEQFRDTKGCRFGVRLVWTHFKNPEVLARFVMLLAVAMLIWFITGVIATVRNRWWRMPCRKKGPRQSYITIGRRLVATELDDLALGLVQIRNLLVDPELRTIDAAHVGGK